MSSPLHAEALPWPKLRALAQAGAVALVPVGSTEAHGPHLPLGVDVRIAEEVCRRTAVRLAARGHSAVIFPALAYGFTQFAAPFAGTVHVSADALLGYMTEVFAGIAQHGFSCVGIVNHHLEPAHFRIVHKAATAAAQATQRKVVAVDHRRGDIAQQLGHEFTHGGSHAGTYETSLMLAVAPHQVDETIRQSLPALDVDLPALIKAGKRDFIECGGNDAYLGNPAEANAVLGNRLLDLLADHAAATLVP